jgi:hypothetical protein
LDAAAGISLSIPEYDLIWSKLGQGEMRYPLQVPSFGLANREQQDIHAVAAASLVDRSLLRDGALDDDLRELMSILVAPEITIDLVGMAGGVIRAVAASSAGGGVLAALDDERLWLWPIRDTALAPTIVDVLPANVPGIGHGIRVPLETLQQAVEPGQDDLALDPFADDSEFDHKRTLRRLGMSAEDAAILSALAESRTNTGQFGVSVAAGTGGEMHRSASVVPWFDTPQGRYLMSSDGAWLSITPAGFERITWRVSEIMEQFVKDWK